jgi:hypothetical protein
MDDTDSPDNATPTPQPARKRQSHKAHVRDKKSEFHVAQLRRDPTFADMPRYLLKSFTGLFMLAQDVRLKLKERGLVRPNGEFDGGIDIYRRLVEGQARFLTTMLEWKQQRSGGAINLPQVMVEHVNDIIDARHVETDPETDD